MRSKSSLFLLFVLALGVIAGIVYSKTAYTFGLDIKGGVRLTYRLKTEQLQSQPGQGTGAQSTSIAEAQSRTVQLLTQRASGLGVKEPQVAAKGTDQIIVELPDVKDPAEAKRVIGSSARINFYHARNVVGPQASYRDYEPIGGKDPTNPVVGFIRRSDGKEILAVKDGEPNPDYLKIIKGWTLILSGNDLANAVANPLGDGFQPMMNFSAAGARKMETWSRAYRGKEENLAAVLDNRVISLTYVSRDAVLSDNAVIQGTFDTAYVQALVSQLNSGALPVDLEEVGGETVDASIGKVALDRIVVAGFIAFGLIAVFMTLYYALPGLVAVAALGLYILFTLTILKLFNATFSLAAIAGFILSVGMAVDANILVFERVKEEISRGKSLTSAITLGFRRALPAIVDSNACTILTSLVLANVGTGPVKGFAITLVIGVVISLFTAITVTRSLLIALGGTKIGSNPAVYAVERNWFKGIEARADTNPLRIVERPIKWFVISAVSILIALPFASGIKFNVEFTGGSEAIYALPNESVTGAQITESLERNGFKGANVKLGTGALKPGQGGTAERIAYVRVQPSPVLAKAADDTERTKIIAQAAGLTDAPSRGFQTVGPTIQKEIREGAIVGVLVSSVLIVLYLAFRFGFGTGGFKAGLRFALSAVGAMVHDILVVVAFAAVVGFFAGWEISALFLTAMLTIIGFSVHDTIVIFDRIRENLHDPRPDDNLATLMDRSITQSFARSINTGLTVIATLVLLATYGTTTPELKFFILAMLVGVASGTYSSIYNASPILYLWDRAVVRRRGEEHGLLGLTRAELLRQRNLGNQVRPTSGIPVTATGPKATADPAANTGAGGRTYGQVKRRANEQKKPGWMELDD